MKIWSKSTKSGSRKSDNEEGTCGKDRLFFCVFFYSLFFLFLVAVENVWQREAAGTCILKSVWQWKKLRFDREGKRLSRGSCWWSRNCHRRVVETGKNEWQSFYVSFKSMYGDRWSCIYWRSIYPSDTTDAIRSRCCCHGCGSLSKLFPCE